MWLYVLLADGFEEMEAIAPIDLMRRAGIDVATVGVTGKDVTGSHGIIVRADREPDEVSPANMQMLVLPGGTAGVDNLALSAKALELVAYACDNNIMVSAICAAPGLLAGAGALKGRRAVVYPGLEPKLEAGGAIPQPGVRVVQDENFLTAQAAGSAVEFGLGIITRIKGWEAAEKVRAAIHL